MLHELGHRIDGMLGISQDDKIRKMYSDFLDGSSDKLSGYARKNVNEFVAEAYSEAKCNPNPRPICVNVYKRMIEIRDGTKNGR